MFSNKLFLHINLFFNSVFLNKHEKDFVNKSSICYRQFAKSKIKIIKKNILIQTVTDYYYLCYYRTLVNDPKYNHYNFIGLWPYFQQTVRRRNFILENLNELYNKIIFYFLFRKWKKLYKSIGIKKIYKLDNKIYYKNRFFKKNFKSRADLFNYKFNNINVGDIIYDTYLRFRARPTLFLNDLFLKKIVNKSYSIANNLEKIYQKYKFDYFFTSYSSYIHHGLPVRFFLKKNVKVFSGKNNSQYNKKLSMNNLSHAEDYKKYKLYYNEVANNKKFLRFSRNDLIYRFSNKKKSNGNLSYLSIDTYNIKKDFFNETKKLQNVEGVLFLQDFYDSPHDWGNLIFDDFYIWTIFTLNIIKKYKLKIAIKPHPTSWHNSVDSVFVYKRLKKKYPDLIWLDKDFPNKLIFKKIKYGISATGTVLFELAYHNIKAISCGDHPGKNFNFTILAKNRKHYKKILLNINNLKKPNYSKKDLLIYNFLYYYYNMDAFENIARKIELKKIDFTNSKSLLEFNKKYKNHILKIS
jgi:hypothetical protein